MNRFILLWIVLLLSASIALSGCQLLTDRQPVIPQDVKEEINQRIENKENTGIVLGVTNPHGRTYYSSGYMTQDSGRAVNQDTLFEIGSVSKVFTALLLADLVEQGEMSLDDPIRSYLPEGVAVPAYKDTSITLEHLATHTAGLPSMPFDFNPGDFDNPYVDFSPDKLYEFFSKTQLYRQPGMEYAYSNLGMGTLGHILTLQNHKDYSTLLEERITGELGMPDTVISLSPEQEERLATGHYNRQAVGNWDFDVLAGAGAIRSTASDMLTFLEANMGLRTSRLQPAMRATQQARMDADSPKVQIGLGWHIRTVDGEQIIWHEGGTGGYYSFAGFNPHRQVGVVILTNTRRTLDEIGFRLLLTGDAGVSE
jgi:D-alanyl-D-alanine-carboxypeptidase/D-alanyl-D-alanine-endopeptidase